MNTNNILYKKVLSRRFKVSPEKVNEQNKLSICAIMSAVTDIHDQVIIALVGNLDFDKISIDHFSLEMTGNASLHDIISLNSYIDIVSEDQIEVRLEGYKRADGKEEMILNGYFAFSIQNADLLHYSLS